MPRMSSAMAEKSIDPEQRNIIIKLANFVARNGPEFEEMTKNKQRGNPKFSFLFGGPQHDFYNRCVAEERANMKAQSLQQMPPVVRHNVPPPLQSNVHPSIQTAPWRQQNPIPHAPSHQSVSFPPVQQPPGMLMQVAPPMHRMGIDANEFNDILKPVIETCSKDSVSNGKNWIFDHTMTIEDCQQIAHLIFNRAVASGVPFIYRLNLIYLINDCLHHCIRKNANDLLRALEHVIPPIFDAAFKSCESADHKQKLDKVLGLWESNKYFSPQLFDQVRHNSAYQQGTPKMQHVDSAGYNVPNMVPPLIPSQQPNAVGNQFPSHATFPQSLANPPNVSLNRPMSHLQPPPNFIAHNPSSSMPPSSGQIPPPPLGMSATTPDANQMQAKYYDLPAGLIVPLTKTCSTEYKSLEPGEVKLPLPQPPDEELLQALDTFYSFETKEGNLDSEGWNIEAVLAFTKTLPKRSKLTRDKRRSYSRSRSRSRSRSPRRRRRRRHSRSESRSPRSDRRRSRSRSSSPRRSRSRSYSPKRSPRDRERRSITPPFVPFQSTRREDFINEDNVGHQLLRKMGWGGSGLGAKEQGIHEPIKEGEVRDKVDQYKGVGVSLNDAFDTYRKSKSYTYNRKPRGSDR
ncbi:Calcium homeostasis endoplasmic reticulum protein [Trichoplax sp. H2]|nr:Calcium homeostasis endoplasmic reticulum protein [Trichoplax sp. H2]|eukprot:RDD42226.1 Calcium homeostasis endoplasmic reticulum protein [Trichoplax sp. H2]